MTKFGQENVDPDSNPTTHLTLHFTIMSPLCLLKFQINCIRRNPYKAQVSWRKLVVANFDLLHGPPQV